MTRGSGETLARAWLDAFPAFAATLDEPPWLRTLRDEALARFAELGLPHAKLEAWRSTSLAALERSAPRAPSGEAPDAQALLDVGRRALAEKTLPGETGPRALFVDGHFCPALSTVSAGNSGVEFRPFGQAADADESALAPPSGFGELASPKHDAFTALNTAFFGGGGVLEIAGPPSAAGPIHLLLVSSGSNGLVCPRLLIHARAGSRETVLLDFVSTGDGEGLVNEVCEIFVEENATLDFILLEREGAKALHVGNLQAHQHTSVRAAATSTTTPSSTTLCPTPRAGRSTREFSPIAPAPSSADSYTSVPTPRKSTAANPIRTCSFPRRRASTPGLSSKSTLTT